ncbi:MAG: TlpA disulfide reductase family protein [Candidatus Neomarinimicrobiota bacterium]
MLARLYGNLRSRWWSSLLLDLAIIGVLFGAVGGWQVRHLLPANDALPAPGFALPGLDGRTYRLADNAGRPVVLYFFAPWCGVCNLSVHNLRQLRAARSEDELTIYLISTGHRSREEVAEFARRHALTLPVLLDRGGTARAYHVQATPTYYILDKQKRIKHRAVGYSTSLGLRLRTALL